MPSRSFLLIPLYAAVKKPGFTRRFVKGPTDGFQTAVRIIPYLVAMLVAVDIFRASGAMDFIVKIFSPAIRLVGMPGELLPLAIMKSLSGAGSNGLRKAILVSTPMGARSEAIEPWKTPGKG